MSEFEAKAHKTLVERARKKGFNQRYICALTTIIKSYGIDTLIVEAWQCNSLTMNQLIENEIELFDKEILKTHWKELNKK